MPCAEHHLSSFVLLAMSDEAYFPHRLHGSTEQLRAAVCLKVLPDRVEEEANATAPPV